jgi:membrane fusion protein (multidrug efflux system)
MRRAICALLLGCAAIAAARAQPAEAPAVSVGVARVEKRAVSRSADFVGRIEAVERVEVRARVTGYLDEVLFREGDLVEAGAPLYRIEQDLFKAAVQKAEGALEVSRAAHTLAELQLQRAQDLLARNAGSVVARDQAAAQEQQARGAVTTDEANLSTAKINLGYTDITAPIAGRIGRTGVTKGNVVSPESGVLAVIVSQDPMHVTFPVSQRELLQLDDRRRQADPAGIKVLIRFSDETVYDQVGRIEFVDVTVDRATDAVSVRALMPNPTGRLIDGQLVRVALEATKPDEKLTVPQAALVADQAGLYVFVVEDGKAQMRRLKIGQEIGADVVVEEGLGAGDAVIVQGLQGMRPGIPVRAGPLPQPGRGM